ncbi:MULTISPECIES: hypothetical protein [Bacillus]|uniref:hypothetical protein n=1 Tax=Bacillus TaxID=1386 RepID=UPI001E41EF1D|nr:MULTISPECIES: hypothetical protein [Bacillus]
MLFGNIKVICTLLHNEKKVSERNINAIRQWYTHHFYYSKSSSFDETVSFKGITENLNDGAAYILE